MESWQAKTTLRLVLGTMTFSGQADAIASRSMIDKFIGAGHAEIDTAHLYNQGRTEVLLGELIAPVQRKALYIAGKVNPWSGQGLQPGEVVRQLSETLRRLHTDYLDLLYLHAPDLETPVEQTLEACFELFQQGKFRHFGLSNYAAWQVAEIAEICRARGWMRPLVYQGMYNALTRDVERELFPCLRHYGIQFYAYNPLAGGLLTGKYRSFDELPDSGRFADFDGYHDRYWKNDYFGAIRNFHAVCETEQIPPSHAALRWLMHHSHLSSAAGDGIILGASKPLHLDDHLNASAEGRLPGAIVDTLAAGWETVRPVCIKYFRP